jgi:hypothetical protein
MLGTSAWFAFGEALSVEVPVRLTRRQAFRKFLVIGAMNFLHPVVRWWGRLRARRPAKHPLAPLRRWHWMRPRHALGEAGHLFRRTPDRRRYWGVGAGPRESLLRELQADLKGRRVAALLGADWDPYDLALGGTLWAVGRLTTASEHYDKALCVGLDVRSTTFGRVLLLLLAGGVAAGAALGPPVVLAAGVLPALLALHLLGQRARLRRATWDSVHDVLAAAGGRPYEDPREAA